MAHDKRNLKSVTNTMLFSLKEIVSWLGLTIFEVWVVLASCWVFSILLALYAEGTIVDNCSWWIVFAPLFAGDGLNAYFCVIIFIRMYMDGVYKAALLRASWSSAFLVLLFVFKYLLCRKLSGQSSLEYSEVMSPLFILLQLVAVRACQIH